MESSSEEQVIRGIVGRVTFRNPDNGYSIIQLKVPDKVEQLTVVGNFADASVGTHLVVRGFYKEHPRFGRQFNARSVTETAPETEEGLVAYISSGIIKGIGEKSAKRLVKEFGTDTMQVILRHPEKLAALSGIGKKKAQLINQAFSEHHETREVMRFLLENNISQKLAKKIQARFGNQTIETLKNDPYILARSDGIRGVGFMKADQIAMNIGLSPDSPQRIKAGLYYTLERASEEGHCYLDREQMAIRAKTLLEVGDNIDLEPIVNELIEEEYLVVDEQAIYLKHLHRAEEFVASFIAARCSENPAADGASKVIADELVESVLQRAEESLGVQFSREQRDAVSAAARKPLLLITGGPGCGKTTIIKALALLFQTAHLRLALAAPTGRAAQRMAQVCEVPARTIHRLLRFNPSDGTFIYNINAPLEVNEMPVDVLIVDEASMIDLMLAKDLFSAISINTKIILVGDKDQLPSVGPGRVFGDLLALKDVPIISLSQLFRRAEQSSINGIAHSINAGLVPEIPEPDGVTKSDAYFIFKRDATEAANVIESLVADQIPKKFGIPSHEICVLTPTNRGPLGTLTLNQKLQARLNPPSSPDQELPLGENVLRLGDRVCQRVNNYQIDAVGVFNGDAGTIFSVDKKIHSLSVEMWDGRLITYDPNDLSQLALAYAITVHRSQGSEIPCVVLALHESHFTLLERQLIYTAVTRAKKLLIIVGSKKALQIACQRTTTSRRCTMLKERIRRRMQ